MKKCDLHIHTISTVTDRPYEFSLDVLKEYVQTRQLDIIAITNHNMFDLVQYETIKKSLANVVVLPGIELDVDGGHVLLLTDDTPEELADFNSKCMQVTPLIVNQNDTIPFSVIHGIYHDFSKYLVIPHVDKEPALPRNTIRSFASTINIGEVGSHKKFISAIKNNAEYSPVLFSDFRAERNADRTNYPVRQTYLDIREVNIGTLKLCLADKAKVGLAPTDGHNLFSCFDDGQCLSTGLNIILGKRSTGKTYTLQRIFDKFADKALYIRQFELLKDQDAQSLSQFDAQDKQTQETIAEDFLFDLRNVVKDVLSVPTEEAELISIGNYVDSLLKFAKEENLADVYSKTRLYNEGKYRLFEVNDLKELIKSTQNLIEDTNYKDTIQKYISIDKLKELYCNLVEQFRDKSLLNKLITIVNSMVQESQTLLRMKSTATVVPNLDLFSCILNSAKRGSFNRLANEVKKEREISRRQIGNFVVLAKARPFRNATDLEPGRKVSMVDAYSKYDQPFEYLQKLKETELNSTTFYTFFTKIEYRILNSFGHPVSGGERTEFNFLQRVKDAMQYDILIIDEPESSFDNVFLKNQVNTLIKDISQLMPVVVSTHNNTIGSSIKPDFLLYTEKIIENNTPIFRLYSGHPDEKELKTIDGLKIKNYTVTLDSLEAGVEAYNERKHCYEILEN